MSHFFVLYENNWSQKYLYCIYSLPLEKLSDNATLVIVIWYIKLIEKNDLNDNNDNGSSSKLRVWRVFAII